MKNLRLKVLAFLLVGSVGFVGCNTEEVEPNTPQISVSGESVMPGNIVYLESEQSSFTLQVNTNRDWQVIIPDHVEWLLATPAQGSGTQTIRFDYGLNDGIQHEATIKIATSTVSVDVRIIQQGAVTSTVLLYESMGSPNVDENTNVADFNPPKYQWTKQGMGIANVAYTGSGASIRTSMGSSGAYLASSGGNNCFFGLSASFVISNIETKENPRVMLTFGCSKAQGQALTEFAPSELPVKYSTDGEATWLDVDYTRTDYNGWGLATGYITFDGEVSQFSLKFTPTINSVIRIDDVTVTGIGGPEITIPVVTTYASTANTPSTADVSAGYAYQQPTPIITEFGIRWKKTSDAEYTAQNVKRSPIAAANRLSVTLDGLETGVEYTYQGYVKTQDGVFTYGNEMTVIPQFPAIYLENFGSTSGQQAFETYTDWQKGGTGGASATYSGTSGLTMRDSYPSNYSGASGSQALFMQPADGTETSFTVSGINITGVTGFDLTFGLITTTASVPSVAFSANNGVNWTPIEVTGKTSDSWQKVSSQIVVAAGSTTLAIKFVGKYLSTYSSGTRFDDISLVRNDAAQGPATPIVITGTAGNITINSATVSGNMFNYPDLGAGTVGVAYRKSGTTSWITVPMSGTAASPYSVALTGLFASTAYEYAAYAGTTANLGAIASFITEADPSSVIWTEDMGPTSSGNPTVSAYTGSWSRGGFYDQSAVTYEGTASVRISSPSASTATPPVPAYAGASGFNNIFFGSPGGLIFTTGNITLQGQTGVKLMFGAWSSLAFSYAQFKLEYMVEGGTWTEVAYTRSDMASGWKTATTGTIPTAGKRSISLRWTGTSADQYRLDDVSMLQDGDLIPLPTPPSSITTSIALLADISRTNATVGGTFTAGDEPITAAGVQYKKQLDLDWTTQAATGSAPFSSPISAALTGLTPATQYIYRIFVTTASGTFYDTATSRTFTTDAASTISYDAANLNGTLTVGTLCTATITIPYINAVAGETCSVATTPTGAGAAGLTVVASVTPTLTVGATGGTITIPVQNAAGTWTPSADGTINFSVSISTGYKTETATVTIKTTSGEVVSAGVTPPTIAAATAPSVIGRTTATIGGSYTAGSETVTAAGIEYKLPADADYTKQAALPFASPFTTNLTGLTAGSTYTFRNYVTADGTDYYGVTSTFSTPAALVFSQSTMVSILTAGTATTAANYLSVPYTGGLTSDTFGPVSVAISGTGAAGIIVATIPTVTLSAGTGTVQIPITGTPTTAGDVTFVISGLTGLTTAKATVLATVAPAGGFSVIWNINGRAAANPTADTPLPATSYLPVTTTVTGNVIGDNMPSANGLASGWGTSQFNTNPLLPADAAAAVDPKHALVRVVSPTKVVSLSKISGNIRRSSTGPSATAVFFQIQGDAGWTALTTVSFSHSAVTTNAGNPFELDLSGETGLQNVVAGKTITFKFIPCGASASGGTWYLNSANTSAPTALKIEGIEQ